jgi:uncharacterized protein YjbI with pentapeptide repeats
MYYFFRNIIITLTILLFLNVLPVNGQNEQREKIWAGKLKDGTTITKLDLDKIIYEHQKWIKTKGKEGIKIDLGRANLQEANLRGANLREAGLRRADLSNTNLSGAFLSGVDLIGAQLYKADLSGVDLSGAYLVDAKLSGANLSGANLNGAELTRINLSGVNLSGVNWSSVSLTDANLSGNDLSGVDLSGLSLYGADLSGTKLTSANLSGAKLSRADLSNTDLSGADLNGADLSLAKLSGTNLLGTVLQGVDLWFADLKGVERIAIDQILSAKNYIFAFYSLNMLQILKLPKNHNERIKEKNFKRYDFKKTDMSSISLEGCNLWGANLSGTNLKKTTLKNANLRKADLSGADLTEADLSAAALNQANLSGAILSGAQLRGADLNEADLSFVVFEPSLNSLPHTSSIIYAENLFKLRFQKSPFALEELRKKFKEAKLRRQELEVINAINYTIRQHRWEKGGWFSKIEQFFYFVFFELTCMYGMRPNRSLFILATLIPFFSFFYWVALKTKRNKTGIWLIFPKESLFNVTGKERPFKLTVRFPPRALPSGRWSKVKLAFFHLYRRIKIAFYFSLLSAFSIGWREFNLGNYLSRLQRREYILRATGWVRTVSGIQSLLSIYLLAIWVVTYFISLLKGFE